MCTRSSLGEAAARAVTRAATGLEALLVSMDNKQTLSLTPTQHTKLQVDTQHPLSPSSPTSFFHPSLRSVLLAIHLQRKNGTNYSLV